MTNIEQLAEELGSNRAYLSNYVNSRFNMNFRNWIASLRIEYSKELMSQNSKISNAELSKATGYSAASFATIFKRHTGLTVAKWKEQNTRS